MAKVILFKNNKGGVGKSLLCFWTAHALTSVVKKNNSEFHKVLILTSDNQNNILQFAGIKNKYGHGLEKYIETGSGELIRLRENLMYIPMTSTKIHKNFENKFNNLIEIFKKQYDFVFIDGSPVLEIDEIFSKAADKVMIPTFLDTVTTTGVTKLIKNVGVNKVALVLPNRTGRSKLEKVHYKELKKILDGLEIGITKPIYQTTKIMNLTEKNKTIWETKSSQYEEIRNVFVEIVKGVIS